MIDFIFNMVNNDKLHTVMLTLVLPGYSKKNKFWADDVAANLKTNGIKRAVYWDHWEDSENKFDVNEKVDLIVGLISKDKANIIAKSVGTLVAAKVAVAIPKKINKLILCGIPSISNERLEIFKSAFNKFDSKKIVCFQNTGDPFVNPDELKEFMKKVNPDIQVIETPRKDHNYPYYEEFNKFILQ